ncbi:hypothetical protein D1007_33291 [Hordeum vulgare]|nr:hypothetical protein D1007_33291 [Hordeum vulgare]
MRAEKWLNAFVRIIALLERAGNALGTMSFIWATVVVLGGLSGDLRHDFWAGTAVVFLEGFRSLALCCGLVDKSGMESIDLYYEEAYATFLQESLLDTTKKMGLLTFAVELLNTDATREKKGNAVRILDSFVQNLRTSNSNDREKVSSLLDAQDQLITPEISAQIVDANGGTADDQQITNGSHSPAVDGNIGIERTRTFRGSSYSLFDIERGNVPTVPGRSRTCKVLLFSMEGICRFGEHIEKLISIPQKESVINDSLPVLGMQILEGLANDLHNCAEICRAVDLLPKIIGFINFTTGKTAAQRHEITTSSLKLVAKIASIKGEIGITLRQEISENPFLIGNLAEILGMGGASSYLEQSKLAMHIIAKIAIDKKTRLNIDAGEALAMLAIDSPHNCTSMLDKSCNELINDLTDKLQRGQHVLGGIMNAEGKQMEALIGLASQICSIMLEKIASVLDSFPDDEAFVDKVVGELNARKKLSPHEIPEIRRLLVQLTVSIVESCPRYALIFRDHGMMGALLIVEQYMGLVSEEQESLPAMVARAKLLVGANTM